MIRFLQPEWLWLLALLPVVMLLRGRRGPVAAVEFSDVGLAREVARTSRTRAGGWLWLLPLLAGALMIVGLARPQRSHSSTDGDRQRHRHRARARCVRLHAGARLSRGRPAGQPHRGGQVRGVEVHRGAAQRPHRPHRLRRRALPGQPAHSRSRLAAAESRARQHRPRRRRRHRHRFGHRRQRQPPAHHQRQIQGRHPAHRRHEQHRQDFAPRRGRSRQGAGREDLHHRRRRARHGAHPGQGRGRQHAPDHGQGGCGREDAADHRPGNRRHVLPRHRHRLAAEDLRADQSPRDHRADRAEVRAPGGALFLGADPAAALWASAVLLQHTRFRRLP